MDSIVSNAAASGSSSAGESVKIHPLVILNISDHFTRVRAQNSMQTSSAKQLNSIQVYGALYGKQEGRKLEMCTSFELALLEGTGANKIDMTYFQSKAERFKEVFGDLEFLGWYTTGGVPDDSDSKIHRQFMDINENPVLLKLSPLQSSASELPLTLWEGCVSSDGEQVSFLKLSYALATDEAERIGVDHVARVSTVHHTRKTTLAAVNPNVVGSSGAAAADALQNSNITVIEPTSTICDQYMSHHSAVKMLHSRVRLILDYICSVQKGELGPVNQEILREINSLCHTLPLVAVSSSSCDATVASGTQGAASSTTNAEEFKAEFLQQYNEVALLSFLGTLMKGCNTINQYAQKFSKVHDQPLGTQPSHPSMRATRQRAAFM